jgi:hypothetical protein
VTLPHVSRVSDAARSSPDRAQSNHSSR